MKTKNKTDVKIESNKLIMTRFFDAPPEIMFDMWSSCDHLKHWWGPKEWPMKECTMDFREGGEWHFCLRGPNEGDESWGLAIYKEIEKPQKIVYQDNFSDEDGNVNEEMPEMMITVEFFKHNSKTRQVSTIIFDTDASLKQTVEMGVVEGTESQMERLDEYLPTIQ